MNLDVSNMPLNTLYRFDTNKYVWSTMLKTSRNGNNVQDEPVKYVEVYEITNEGYIDLIASGRLAPNPNSPDYNHGFAIWDYDQDKLVNFDVTMYLEELTLRDLYEIRDAIALNNKIRNKKY